AAPLAGASLPHAASGSACAAGVLRAASTESQEQDQDAKKLQAHECPPRRQDGPAECEFLRVSTKAVNPTALSAGRSTQCPRGGRQRRSPPRPAAARDRPRRRAPLPRWTS